MPPKTGDVANMTGFRPDDSNVARESWYSHQKWLPSNEVQKTTGGDRLDAKWS